MIHKLRILLTLILIALCAWAAVAYAAPTVRLVDENDRSIESRQLKVYTVTNTTYRQYTLVPLTTIVPNKTRILGYSIIPHTGTIGTELIATLYDDSTTGVTQGLVINEAEVTTTDQRPIWFPSPIKVTYGLVVRAGAGCDILIYYLE